MKKLIIIFCVAWAAIAVSKGIIEKFNTDKIQFGVNGSTDEKSITVDTGDGVSNPKISVDATSKEFTLNKALNVVANIFRLGDGTGTSEAEIINNNGTANPPKIKFDNGLGAWTFSNDGTLVKKFGSGSGGGGGGINLAQLQGINVGFEDGFDVGWTGTAGVASEANSGLQLNGEKSLILDTATQGDFYETPTFNIIEGLKGIACQFGVSYKGGNGEINAQLLIDGVVSQEITLEARSIKSDESVGFICPTSGSFKFRFEQKLTADAVAVTIDDLYIGSLVGLTETTLPDVLSAKISNTGVVSDENTDWINGNLTVSGNDFTLDYSHLGLSSQLNCTAIAKANFSWVSIKSESPGVIVLETFLDYSGNGASTQAREFSLICQKSGADAKQTVQVYKSIPKVSENVNNLEAEIASGTGAVAVEYDSANWISSVNRSGSNSYKVDVTPNNGVFSELPICSCNNSQSGGYCHYNTGQSSPTNLVFYNYSTTTTNSGSITVKCIKAGSDFKLPTVQPIVVGQVRNSYAESASKNVRTESCSTTGGTVPVFDSPMCASWINSVLNNSGTSRFDFTGSFKSTPDCVVSTAGSDSVNCFKYLGGGSQNDENTLDILCENSGSGGNQFTDISLICTGEI